MLFAFLLRTVRLGLATTVAALVIAAPSSAFAVTTIAIDDSYEIQEDSELFVNAPGVTLNDVAPLLGWAPLSMPSHGHLESGPGGWFRYTPVADFAGTDSFAYAYVTWPFGATTPTLLSNAATVTINVAAAPDAPVAMDDIGTSGQLEPLTSGDTVNGVGFGSAVAVSDDLVVVGASAWEGSRGKAHIYARRHGQWALESVVKASDGTWNHRFGAAVAVLGDEVFVGAPNNESVYVFRRTTAGWVQDRKLAPVGKVGPGSRFGASLSANGNRLVVGAPYDAEYGTMSGTAYLFEKVDGSWAQVRKLTDISGAGSGSEFGSSVGISGDSIIVGAPKHDTDYYDTGAAYLFERVDGDWTHQATWTLNWHTQRRLGSAVAIDGSIAAASSAYDYDWNIFSGDVRLYHRGDAGWAEQTVLRDPDRQEGDGFGTALCFDGETLLVGAPGANQGNGKVHVYRLSPDGWKRVQAILPPAPLPGDGFAGNMAIGGVGMVFGLPGRDVPNVNTGAALWAVNRYEVPVGAPLIVEAPGVMGNDIEFDGEALSASLEASPAHGVAWLDASGGLRYEPTVGYTGHDTVSYTVSDGATSSRPADVRVSVFRENTAPDAQADLFTTAQETTLSLPVADVLANDVNDDGDVLEVSISHAPAHGTVTMNAGSFVYVPDRHWHGVDTFSYAINDGFGGTDSAVVSVEATRRPGVVGRIGGSDRWTVAANAARVGWDPKGDGSWPGLTDVVVVNGETGKEADPVSAAGVAGVYDAPILLVRVTGVPGATRSVLTSMAKARPGLRVHVVGGPGSVPDTVWAQLKAIPGVSPVKDRIGGADRYEVTVNIARRMASVVGTANVPAVLIADVSPRANFHIALALSPASYRAHAPILGWDKTNATLSPSVKALLISGFAQTPKYAANAPYGSLQAAALGSVGTTMSVAKGADRTTAALNFASDARAHGWLTPYEIGVATAFPDALSGGALMGKRGGALVYNDGVRAGLPYLVPSLARYLESVRGTPDSVENGWVLGGPASITESASAELAELIR